MATHVIDTVVVGAGQAGLATSSLLTRAGRDHVLLERGRPGERWTTERWDSLRLLTPNWMNRLPGWYYGGPDPDGFMAARDFGRSLERYAATTGAPVIGGTTVHSLGHAAGGWFVLRTDRDDWRARHVVVATGPHAVPVLPEPLAATEVGADITVMTAGRYRNPATVPAGGVLVVGSSATGVQIADELVRSGREVTLAVGSHTRMPRRYRGMDIFWWLERTGRLARTIDDVRDPAGARREPSPQLIGSDDERADLDLASLHARGVRLTGRLTGIADGVARFDSTLPASVTAAERRMHRFLDAVDADVEETGLAAEVLAGWRPSAFVPPPAPERLPLREHGISTVVAASGFRPDHSWIQLPVLGDDGHVQQYRGGTRVPGLYVVGQRFQHRRDGSFIGGARFNAQDVVARIATGALPRETASGCRESA